MKPRIVLDIKSKDIHTFSRRKTRIYCRAEKTYTIPLRRISKIIGLSAAVIYFAFGSVVAPHLSLSASFAQTSAELQERAQLERELAELERQIAEDEATLAAYRREGKSLSSEINRLNTKISSLGRQIRAINLSLTQIDTEIETTQESIAETEARIERQKKAIGSSLQGVYESERVSLITVLLKNPNLTDFFNDINNHLEIQNQLTTVIKEVEALRDELWDEKEALALQKEDTIALKAYQDKQQRVIEQTKAEKKNLLEVTQGEESKYQTIVAEKKKTAAEIRNRIFKFLGGGEMTFEEAYELAKFAHQATGVEPAFILAILHRESRLGSNVGRCTYRTSMAPGPPESRRDDVTPFLEITQELGLDPETTLVSCANSDGAYGGAMGPTQFIPTTWMMYKDRLADIVGTTPSPWNNAHAITATGLYLKDALRGCTQYSKKSTQTRCAAARYYAGGHYKRHMWTSYGNGTMNKMYEFQDDIQILENSQ